MAWFPLLFLFVSIPLLDHALGRDPRDPADASLDRDGRFMVPTLLAVPVQLALLGWSARVFAGDPLGPVGELGWLVSQGIVGGVPAINTAHERVHKDTRLEHAAGGSCCRASTIRASRSNTCAATTCTCRRREMHRTSATGSRPGASCRRRSHRTRSAHGASRPSRHEHMTHLQSWNPDFLLSKLLLFHLQRHSEHHETPRRRDQSLLHHAGSPQLPAGDASMSARAVPAGLVPGHASGARALAGHAA